METKLIRSLLLVRVTTHGWGGGATDGEAATEYATSKNADASRYNVYVDFLPDDLASRVSKARANVAKVWRSRTLPFKDGGWRVLLAENYLDLLEAIAPVKSEYEAAAQEVLDSYDMILSAAKTALNGGFRQELFPTRETLSAKYWVEVGTEPVVTGEDIRVEGLTAAATEMVRESVERTVNACIAGAVREMADSLKGLVESYRAKLDNAKAGKAVKFGGLARAAKEQCAALRKLNLTRDAAVDEIIRRVEELVKMTLDTETASGWVGVAQAKKADSLAEAIESAFGDWK